MELEKMSLEQAIEQLEETISRLEADDISLEDSFIAYKEGMDILKHCNKSIDKVEKQVLMIAGEGELETYKADKAGE